LYPKVKAGYLNVYADPEYIERLQQTIQNRKAQGFPVERFDTLPADGSIIVDAVLKS
jgi:hypothetical protein